MTAETQIISEIADKFSINIMLARRLFSIADKNDLLADIAKQLAEKPKPFLKWAGGKRQLLKQFRELNLYPPVNFDPQKNTYFEPFIGGGAVFFDLLPARAELSDLNKELVTTYNIIKSNVEELIKALKKHEYSKEHYIKIRALDVNKLTDLETASRFIFLNRTGFNGLYRVNKCGKFNVPFGRYKNPLICDEKNLRRVASTLLYSRIKHQDYKEILTRAQSGDFIYFDPPYFPVSKTASFTAYTATGFFAKEQVELRDVFLKLARKGCFVMLSNSDTSFIRDLYSAIGKIKINHITAGRAINSNGKGRGKIKELLITNY